MVKYTAVIGWYLFSVWKRAKVGWREKMPDSTSRSFSWSSGSMYFLSFSWRVKARAITQWAHSGKKLDIYNSAYLFTLIKISHRWTFGDQIQPISYDALSLDDRGIIGNSMGYAIKAACEGCIATADDELMTFSVEWMSITLGELWFWLFLCSENCHTAHSLSFNNARTALDRQMNDVTVKVIMVISFNA